MDKILILFFYIRARYFLRFGNRRQLERWQEKKVLGFLRWLLPRSPYTRERFGQRGIADWREVPVIGKKEMMENLSSLNTCGIDRDEAFRTAIRAEETRDFSPTIGKVTVGLSSGTSGNRGLFLVSPMERYRHAGTILAKVLPGSILERHRIAFFLRADSNLYSTSNSSRLQFRFFDLLKPFDSQIERLQDLNPTLFIAPPSLLRIAADAQIAGKLSIRPKKIVSVAEVLDPIDQQHIEKAFNQVVHQVYQCTEGFLGVTCRLGRLHLNEDVALIEKDYLDRDAGKFYPIITDFSRTTQPIIRYRLNDILTETKKPCACGSPLLALETIEGRSDDLLLFTSAGKTREVFPDFIRRAIITASDEVDEYRVVQKRIDSLTVSLRSKNPGPVQAKVEASISGMLEELGCDAPEIDFDESLETVVLTAGGKKLRRIVRDFTLERSP